MLQYRNMAYPENPTSQDKKTTATRFIFDPTPDLNGCCFSDHRTFPDDPNEFKPFPLIKDDQLEEE